MALKEFLLVALVVSLFQSPLKALQSGLSSCLKTTDCDHRIWKTTVCIDCRNRGLYNPTKDAKWSITTNTDAIDLSGNNLRNTNIHVGNDISLKYLSFSQNDIESIGPLDDQGLATLRYVYLNGNRINRLPKDAFVNLKVLKWLDLSSNSISSKHIDLYWAGNGSKLEGLDLSSNIMSTLTRNMFIGLTSLRNLYLWDNNISVIDSRWSDGLHNLKHLIISHNKLSEISNITFSGLQNLQTLHLQFNNITHLDGGWTQDLHNLTSLDVSYNNIAHVYPETLVHLRSIVILNLSHNPRVHVDLLVYPMLKTLYISHIQVENISLLLDTILPNMSTLYVDEIQWNLTDEATKSNLYSKGIDVIVEEIHDSEHVSMNKTSTTAPVQPQWAFWFLLLFAIALLAACVAAAFCLHRAIDKQRHYKHQIHMRRKQSIVYVPFAESLKLRNSAASSRCGTFDSRNQDGTNTQGYKVETTGPGTKRQMSGVAAAFSELRTVQCSSDIEQLDVPKLGSGFLTDSVTGEEGIISDGLHYERKPTAMISFKPIAYRQRRRNSLPDRPISHNRDGWIYEVISPESDKVPCLSNAGSNRAQLSRDSKVFYQNIAGRCWTSRAERLFAQPKTKSKNTTKYNLLRSLSTPTELECEIENLVSESKDAPPVAPRPIITLTRTNSDGYENLETPLDQECARHKVWVHSKVSASPLVRKGNNNDDGHGAAQRDLYDEVFDEEDNYITVLPSETDNSSEVKETQMDVRQQPEGANDIKPPNEHHSQSPENLYDHVDDTDVEQGGDDANTEFTEGPNHDDVESLEDYAMALSETDDDIDDSVQLYDNDGKLLRIPSVRDSVLTQSTFDTVSLLLSSSGENLFSSTSSFEFDEDEIEKPKLISEMHTL